VLCAGINLRDRTFDGSYEVGDFRKSKAIDCAGVLLTVPLEDALSMSQGKKSETIKKACKHFFGLHAFIRTYEK